VICLEILNRNKEQSINQVINSVLTEVFGKKAAMTIYRYLENTYEISPSQFSANLELFSKGLEECLSTAAIPVETKIVHALSYE
jgi:hypothetical protein